MNSQVHSKVNGDLLFFLFLVLAAIVAAFGYAVVEVIDGLSVWIGKRMFVQDATNALLISIACVVTTTVTLTAAVVFAFRKSAQLRRQREFLNWNPDLDGAAIRKTVSHMKKHTGYTNVRFGTVGSALEREFCSNVHPASTDDAFDYEVLRVYLHFIDPKSYPLPKSSCPRK